MRFVRLSEEEKSELEKLYKTNSNSVIRNRCLSLLYSNEQRSIKEVSQLVRIFRHNLERLFDSWESVQDKYKTLSISAGRGAKVKLSIMMMLIGFYRLMAF
ncbi:hypothetical protein FACS1894179_03020 [Bacteroidia bacterium]|nr:hypothetical protein FACS1894169_11560 [Bacteroidia bacterium]GHV38917.1 hypothetical protein FACS1894179_03020 [Bacteroidia bacterium]